jgi:hypothetical protein
MKLEVRAFMDALAEPTRLRSLVLLMCEEPPRRISVLIIRSKR